MTTQPVTSTLYASELRFRRLTLALTWGCAAATLCLAVAGAAQGVRMPVLWAICLACACAGHASNLWYVHTHRTPTIGMMPVALFSLLPALVAQMTCYPPSEAPRTLALVTATLALVLAVFVLWFARLRLTYSVRPQVSGDACLIVLGGAVRDGRPQPTLARRLDVAAQLWDEDPRRTIVVSGGPAPGTSTTEAQVMAHYLQQHGVATASIMRESKARNTQENIERSCTLLDARGLHTQRCVVSSDYHLWRACRDGRKLGVRLTPIPARTPIMSLPQQWCREVLTILAGR